MYTCSTHLRPDHIDDGTHLSRDKPRSVYGAKNKGEKQIHISFLGSLKTDYNGKRTASRSRRGMLRMKMMKRMMMMLWMMMCSAIMIVKVNKPEKATTAAAAQHPSQQHAAPLCATPATKTIRTTATTTK